ncbi:MAG TPA: 50S ribosomal protein L10, partial [Acidobacteriaceae bacterium]|nr:50S ribosomal protein L10 [Acidobacteriaceae bacterium]
LFLIQSPAQRLVTVLNAAGRDLAVVINQGVEKGKFAGSASAPSSEAPTASAKAASEKPAAEVTQAPGAEIEAAHVVEAAAGEQPSGAEQPENSTASQGGEAAASDPVEGA